MRSNALFVIFILLLVAHTTVSCSDAGVVAKAHLKAAEETARQSGIKGGAQVVVESSDLEKIRNHRFMTLSGLPAGAQVLYTASTREELEKKVETDGTVKIMVQLNSTVEVRVIHGPYGKGFKAVLDTDIDYDWNQNQKSYIRLTAEKK